MTVVLALLELVLLLIMPSAALGEQSTKRFVPGDVVNPTAFYPEGPQLMPDGLLVSEMAKDRIVLLKDHAPPEVKWEVKGCGPTSIKHIPSGGYWILCHLGYVVVRVDENFETVKTFQYSSSGKRITWPNDAWLDSKGNIYLSSSGPYSLDAAPQGRVVYISVDNGVPQDLVTGIRYSNGVLVQEAKGRVLVSEMLNRRVLAYPLLGPGKLGPARLFFDFKDAPPVPDSYELSGPDGMAAFKDGDILVADYGNGRVLLISDQGKFLQQIPVQYRFVDNMAITPDQNSVYFLMTENNLSADLHGMVQRFAVQSTKSK
jgi:sugar lactone lactonase YvrE